ncbi:MAG: hypothetical protein QM811_32065 [Pirellulales bacterium]
MKSVLLALWCLAFGVVSTLAADDPFGDKTKAADPKSRGRTVSIEIVILETAETANGQENVEATPARLKEWESQNKVRAVTRLRVHALEGTEALVQLGERVPTATSRQVVRSSSGFGGRAPRDAGGETPAAKSAAKLRHIRRHTPSNILERSCKRRRRFWTTAKSNSICASRNPPPPS